MARECSSGEILTKDKLQEFALGFDRNIAAPLIEAGLGRYNVFDILNIGRQELRHSDFLAFLFDPDRSGETGRRFVRNFSAMLASEGITDELDFFEMYYGSIEKVKVGREVSAGGGRIDLLVEIEIFKDKPKKILIAIENKIDSGEHDNQLEKYKAYLTGNRYKDHDSKIFLFLSPYKTEPTVYGWIAIDYGFIYRVMDKVDIKDADGTIAVLIGDYKEMIMSEFAKDIDNELKRKAVEIYKNNRKIFDFIYGCKPDRIYETAKIVREFLKRKGAQFESERQNVYIAFRTKELADHKDHWFQINLDDLSLIVLYKDNKWKRFCEKKWLFGDSQGSADAVKRFQDLVFETDKLREDCEAMLENVFSDGGLIGQCLAEIRSAGK